MQWAFFVVAELYLLHFNAHRKTDCSHRTVGHILTVTLAGSPRCCLCCFRGEKRRRVKDKSNGVNSNKSAAFYLQDDEEHEPKA